MKKIIRYISSTCNALRRRRALANLHRISGTSITRAAAIAKYMSGHIPEYTLGDLVGRTIETSYPSIGALNDDLAYIYLKVKVNNSGLEKVQYINSTELSVIEEIKNADLKQWFCSSSGYYVEYQKELERTCYIVTALAGVMADVPEDSEMAYHYKVKTKNIIDEVCKVLEQLK